ncbi:MAG: hypothetical protein ACXU8Z_09875 [Caulobacteraceae bacterium]
MSCGAMEWRQRFAAYKAALAAHERAQVCLEALQSRLAACAAENERAALEEGVAVAKRRLRLTSKVLDQATAAFTQGLSVLEAIWSAPDEV